MPDVNRILVPVDTSASARAVCDYAIGLADAFDARGVILHVRPPPPASTRTLPEPSVLPWDCSEEVRETLREESPQDTQELIDALPEQVRSRFFVEIEQGEIVPTILDVAAREQADLIVIGTHGRRGLGHLLLGSVAEKVVRRAACPVLTVRLPNASM